MGLFKKLDVTGIPTIDWEMTPEYSFGTFESWGGIKRIRSKTERFYYFFVDNWGKRPKLCLMERGIKHARIVAEIRAPEDKIQRCVDSQGKAALFEQNFAIDEVLKQWLIDNIFETDNDSMVIPLKMKPEKEIGESGLPARETSLPEISRVALPDQPEEVSEEDVTRLVLRYNFFDQERNQSGEFRSAFVDNGDDLTVSDRVTGLMWQRNGIDIMSHRMLDKEIVQLNKKRFAGYSDWRLPTMAEALSLMEREKNEQGQFLHQCFSAQQPFIFVAALRNPGGYWFVDYNQARVFWASGTIPGGFGRLCRRDAW